MVDITFKVPIYNTKIKLVVNADLDKYCKENEIDDRGINFRAAIYDFSKYNRDFDLIALFPVDVKSNDIQHEVNHLTFAIFRDISMPISEDSEEAFCYLSEYLYKKITNVIIVERSKLKAEE